MWWWRKMARTAMASQSRLCLARPCGPFRVYTHDVSTFLSTPHSTHPIDSMPSDER
jgi:hypothetical protein